MKRTITILSLIILMITACKKSETEKPNGMYDVSFVFNTNGNESNITFKNIQTGEVKTYTKQTGQIVIDNQVKVGDRFVLDMKGQADGLDENYYIRVLYKNTRISAVRALGAAGKRDQNLTLDKTFLELDFQNK